jgi:hypothetical protein
MAARDARDFHIDAGPVACRVGRGLVRSRGDAHQRRRSRLFGFSF